MKSSENDNRLQHELRLAQLEIKALRERLSRAKEGTEVSRDTAEIGAPNNFIAGKRRVLYIEDSEPNFHLVESILRDRPDADLLWAKNGEAGFDLARKEKPQLILLDLNLPDIHGSEVLERLQSEPATSQTPVIVISADATPSQIERMLAAGARNYLTKPFEIRRFLYMFDEAFAEV